MTAQKHKYASFEIFITQIAFNDSKFKKHCPNHFYVMYRVSKKNSIDKRHDWNGQTFSFTRPCDHVIGLFSVIFAQKCHKAVKNSMFPLQMRSVCTPIWYIRPKRINSNVQSFPIKFSLNECVLFRRKELSIKSEQRERERAIWERWSFNMRPSISSPFWCSSIFLFI